MVLVALGFSGAWIGNLTVLEPYRPLFIGVALVALLFAWRRIFRPASACKPGEVCAIPQVRATYKLIFWIVAMLVLVALGFPYVVPFFYVTCPITVKKALSKVEGVSKVDVGFEKREAVVTFDDAKTNAQKLTKATQDAGYPSSVKQ